MNLSKFTNSPTRGSALITVVSLIFIMAMLSASIIGYSLFERRMSERSRLSLRAENVAENISLYAAEQLTVKLQGMGTPAVGHFPWSGPSTDTMIVYMPPGSATGTDNVLVSEYNTPAAAAAMEVRAGIEAITGYAKVNDTTSSNNGLQIATANVPIISKGTATHSSIGTITSYLEQDMQLTLIPLFQFGMFYNMDLELYPSGNLTLTGPVHTNNSLFVHPDAGSSIDIRFTDRVTAADYIFANQALKCDTRGGSGTKSTPGTTADLAAGSVYFTDATSVLTPKAQIDMKSNGSSTIYPGIASTLWADARWGDLTKNATTNLPTSTNFRDWEGNTYHGNLRSKLDNVTKLVLPGIGGYKETNDPSTPEDDRNNGRQIIESPDHKRYNGTTFATSIDSAAIKQVKISWRAGLYIMVNPSDTIRSAELPDGTTAKVAPHSYRCWLNTRSGSSHVCVEVVLPGQPSYGQAPGLDGTLDTADDGMYLNYLPNRLMNGTSVGSNQVLRTIQQPYGTGTGYALAANGAINDTSLTVGVGTGTILAGDVVTIGAYKYLVAADLSGTTLNLASPGLIAAAASGATVTINAPTNSLGTGTGYLINKGSGYVAGTTATPVNALTIDTGSGTILPGNTISIGSGAGTYKYLVTAVSTAAPPLTAVWIAKPGLVAAVSDNTAVTIDSNSGTLGTATDYAISSVPALGATSLAVNRGIGTLLPGNIVVIGSGVSAYRYLVTSASNNNTATTALTAITITPGLLSIPAVGDLVSVDPYPYSGYASSGNGGSGSVYPADGATKAYAAEAYFYDLRRANNNGAMGNANAASDFNRTVSTPFIPRPIAKIDLDMARFKMMVNRAVSSATTSSGYQLNLPASDGVGWANCIYNPGGAAVSLGLGIYDGSSYSTTACFPATTDAVTKVRQDPFGLYYAPTSSSLRDAVFTNPTQFAVPSTDLTAAWYDGVAVYIHSIDAEVRAQTTPGIADRIDSGVRLVNGRGPVASLAPNSPDTLSGCTIATNDATYIIGHFNADGTINSTLGSTGFGGYSSTWPDSSTEYLCAVYGDATAIMSQPTYTQTGSSAPFTYAQTNGWCDSMSALPHTANTSSTWSTAAGGSVDGVIIASPNGLAPGALPTTNKPTGAGTAYIKLPGITTEISTVLVIGIVPSNHNPAGLSDRPPCTVANNVNSGGANNFPRFLETWSNSASLYIRGSMVALFESRVAMEPFTHSRSYNRPVRCWGLNNNLSLANHHVPLEPIVYSADRLGFHQLTAAQYATRKAAIEGWAVIAP